MEQSIRARVKTAAWRFHKTVCQLYGETLNSVLIPFRHTDICGIDFYSGLPSGVTRLTELVWGLVEEISEFRSTRIVSPYSFSRNIGRPITTLWFANAVDLPKAIKRFRWFYHHSSRRIGYWAYELEEMPADQARNASLLSEVWCPSEFVASSIRRSCSIPTFVIPPPILLDKSLENRKTDYSSINKFLVVFDAYSSVQRKNPWAAISAFNEVFGGDETKTLTVRVVRERGLTQNLKSRLLAERSPQVSVIFETFATAKLAHDFMKQHDVYLSLHRTEGLGFNIIEAILLGLPVIATNYGGNTDFCHRSGVDLIDYELVPVIDPQDLYEGDFFWAEPKMADVCNALKKMVSRTPAELQERATHARKAVLDHFDSELVRNLIRERLYA